MADEAEKPEKAKLKYHRQWDDRTYTLPLPPNKRAEMKQVCDNTTLLQKQTSVIAAITFESRFRRLRDILCEGPLRDDRICEAVEIVMNKATDRDDPEQMKAADMVCGLRGLNVKQVAAEITNRIDPAEARAKLSAFFGMDEDELPPMMDQQSITDMPSEHRDSD